MLLHEIGGSFLDISRAAVVSEPLPEFEDGCFGGSMEGLNVGQCFHPAVEIGDHGSDLSLLKHHFRNPGSVRSSLFTPGQSTGIS